MRSSKGPDFFELASVIDRYRLGINHEGYRVLGKIRSYLTTIIALRRLLRSILSIFIRGLCVQFKLKYLVKEF